MQHPPCTRRNSDETAKMGGVRKRPRTAADAHARGGVRVVRDRLSGRVHTRWARPNNPESVAQKWTEEHPPHTVVEAVKAAAVSPVRTPFVAGGVQWSTGCGNSTRVDLRAVADAASLKLPIELYESVYKHCPAAAAAAAVNPALFSEASRVKRADLFWLVATARAAVYARPDSVEPFHAVLQGTWRFTIGTVALRHFQSALVATESTVAFPGTDVSIDNYKAIALPARDKAIIAITLLWGKPWAWAVNPPPCAPVEFAAVASTLK